MLMWESLDASRYQAKKKKTEPNGDGRNLSVESVRLPFDKRCSARTKSGERCRGTIRPGKPYCLFHDPAMTAERRQHMAAKAAQTRRRLMHLPDGYLRKLTSLTAVGEAMDRLYREVRLGVITPEMAGVMFNILTRLMDSGLVTAGPKPERTKAACLRPKLRDLLTRAERSACEQAIANAGEKQDARSTKGASKRRQKPQTAFVTAVAERTKPRSAVPVPVPLSFQAAS